MKLQWQTIYIYYYYKLQYKLSFIGLKAIQVQFERTSPGVKSSSGCTSQTADHTTGQGTLHNVM